ncbi:MAG: FHA domain-containing protein [Myxococcota bacterium]|nr:FHA domain-containing protein [Myxococcota bacterium]
MTPPALVAAALKPPDGPAVWLTPGQLIGRAASAALRLDDPCVSEAHALLSLRGDQLKLLALRGRLEHGGKLVDTVTLQIGARIGVSRSLSLQVVDLLLPESVICLEGPGLSSTVLPGAVSLHLGPPPRLDHATARGADALLWPSGGHWRLSHGDQTRSLQPGDSFSLSGQRFTLSARPVHGTHPTQRHDGLSEGLRLVCRYDSVHVFPAVGDPVVINGVAAQLISELAEFGVPVSWTMLAEGVWGQRVSPTRLRKRLDGALLRLRGTLREGGIRADLVRPMGNGMIELFLHPADTVAQD